jgi:hypothetical protein
MKRENRENLGTGRESDRCELIDVAEIVLGADSLYSVNEQSL